MKLFYRKFGSGEPLMILHGLFGQSDNWNTLAKKLGETGKEVYTVDLRNHGLSPHSEEWNYNVMASDILELITDLDLHHVNLLGHSLGGTVAMQFALKHKDKLARLIIADMAPREYPPHQDEVIRGLLSVDFSRVKTRKDAEAQLGKYVKEEGTKQFLLKNLFWKTDTELAWRFNLKVIAENYLELWTNPDGGPLFDPNYIPCEIPAWFIRGERSDYIRDSDIPLIKTMFPMAELITIPDAGHWIHAEKPQLFLESVQEILKS